MSVAEFAYAEVTVQLTFYETMQAVYKFEIEF
jgi:hypothetical protein